MRKLRKIYIPKVVVFLTILFLLGLKIFSGYAYLFKRDPEFINLLLLDNPYI